MMMRSNEAVLIEDVLINGLVVLCAPSSECNDCVTQIEPALGQRVGAGVVPEGQTGKHAGRFELAQTGREYVRRHPEVALQIAISLRPVKQPLHDEQGPPCSNDVKGRGEAAHAFGSASAFIQNGE